MTIDRSVRMRRTLRLLLDAIDSFADVHAYLTADYAEPNDLVWRSTGRPTAQIDDNDAISIDGTDDVQFELACNATTIKSSGWLCNVLVNRIVTTIPFCLAFINPKSVDFWLRPDRLTRQAVDVTNNFRIAVSLTDRRRSVRLSVSTGAAPVVGCFRPDGPIDTVYLTVCSCDVSSTITTVSLAPDS